MPFTSQAQRRFMFSQHPDIAERWAKETPKGADLPEHVKKFADGGSVMMPPLGAPPERPPIQATPQPLQLPGVSYKPYSPNPRTSRSLVKRANTVSRPMPTAQFRLGGGGRGAGADRFSLLGTSPFFGGGGDTGMPGFGVGPQQPSNPDDLYQGLPGFAGGGVVRFDDGGGVDYNPGDWWNTPLDQLAQMSDEERKRREEEAQAYTPQNIQAPPAPPPPSGVGSLLSNAMQQGNPVLGGGPNLATYIPQSPEQLATTGQELQMQGGAMDPTAWYDAARRDAEAQRQQQEGGGSGVLNGIAQAAGFIPGLGPAITAGRAANDVANNFISGGLMGGAGELLNKAPLPVVGPAFNQLNQIADQFGVPEQVRAPTNLGQLMQDMTLPGQGVEQIPGFERQPEALQSFERNAANLAPFVLGGPESAIAKAAMVGLGAGGQTLDEQLGTDVTPLGGPFGLAGLVGPGVAESLMQRAPAAVAEQAATRELPAVAEMPTMTDAQLMRSSKVDLQAMARDQGVDISGARYKADIVQAIQAGQQLSGPEAEFQKAIGDVQRQLERALTPEERQGLQDIYYSELSPAKEGTPPPVDDSLDPLTQTKQQAAANGFLNPELLTLPDAKLATDLHAQATQEMLSQNADKAAARTQQLEGVVDDVASRPAPTDTGVGHGPLQPYPAQGEPINPLPQLPDKPLSLMTRQELADEADRLGVPVDKGAIMRGGQLALEDERMKIGAAQDQAIQDLQGNMGRAAGGYFGDLMPNPEAVARAEQLANDRVALQMQVGQGFPVSPDTLAKQTEVLSNQQLQAQAAAWLQAGYPGSDPEMVMRVLREFQAQNLALLPVQSPEGMAKLSGMVRSALAGELNDSYLTTLQRRLGYLETALRRADPELGAKDIAGILKEQRDYELGQRYGTQPQRLKAATDTLDDITRRASSEGLEKVMLEANQRFKNLLFPLDLGVFGQQMLSGLRNGIVPATLGVTNRTLNALSLPFARDLYTEGNLPKVLQTALDGGKIHGPDTVPGAGTPFRYVPGVGKYIDRPLDSLIGALDKFQFSTMLGGFRNLVYEGNLYALDLAGHDINNPAVRQLAMRNTNNIGSAAELALTPGRRKLEALAELTPGMTRANINSLLDMSKLVRPGANDAERVLAAMMVMSNATVLLGIGKLVNDHVGIRPFEMDPMSLGFANITLPTRDDNGDHHRISIFPQASMQRALLGSAQALAGRDPNALAETWARYVAGREGLWLRSATSPMGFGYDQQGKFHMGINVPGVGSFGEPMGVKEGVMSGAPIPQMVPTVANLTGHGEPFGMGERPDVVGAGLNLLGVNTGAESPLAEAHFASREMKTQGENLLGDPAWREAHFPGEWGRELQGKTYNELQPDEKAILKQGMRESGNDSGLRDLEALDKRLGQSPLTKASDEAAAAREDTAKYKQAMLDVLNNGQSDLGTYDKSGKREGFSTKYYAGTKQLSQAEAAPYNEQSYKDAAAEADQKSKQDRAESVAKGQPAPGGYELDDLMARYRQLNALKGDDGTWTDEERRLYNEGKRDLLVEAKDKGVGERFAHEIQSRPQEEVDRYFDKAKPIVDAYFDRGTGTTAASWLAAHPRENAVLWYLGYVDSVRSQQAYDLGYQLTHENGGSRVPTRR